MIFLDNYSLSDLRAAVDGGNDGFGGSWVWVILLFILLCGGWNGGWGNRQGEFGQYATAASQQEILFGQQFGQLNDRLTNIGNGICDSTFALNNTITTEGRNLSTQLAQCLKNAYKAIKAFGTKNAVDTCTA